MHKGVNVRVVVVQISSGQDADRNMAHLEAMLSQVEQADLIALPEVVLTRGGPDDYRRAALPLPNAAIERLAACAAERNAWLQAGTVIESDGACTYNTALLFDRSGRIAATYRKIHLFEAFLDDGTHIRESDYYQAGTNPVTVNVEGWRTGLSVCYDIRFPELYRHYASAGAELFLVPADFTQRTGRDHWSVLLRARAIENQAFVVAANQCGTNTVSGVTSYGHSMIVDPWGEILNEAGEDEDIITAELTRERLDAVRQRVPALQHRVL